MTAPVQQLRLINRLDEPGTEICNRTGQFTGKLICLWADWAWIVWDLQPDHVPETWNRTDIWTFAPAQDSPF